MDSFYRNLPKVELHAHLNGSLSQSTFLQLKRLQADSGITDSTDAFFDEFKIGSGDSWNMANLFQIYGIAHSLTSTPAALALATRLTLKEFEEDGCCYIELRSTPKETQHMSRQDYVKTIVDTIRSYSSQSSMTSKLIISINRCSKNTEVDDVTSLAIEYFKLHPDVVLGIELSGDPALGNFQDFAPALTRARTAGLKVSLHCGEICNSNEILEMLKFNPERIGHGVCIHPNYGGTEETWKLLCQLKIPVEVCLTSNVNTKSIIDFESHPFKMLQEANIPIVLCTDDKGLFSTSLSQEYRICAETFKLDKQQIVELALNAVKYIFDTEKINFIVSKIKKYVDNME